MFPLNIVIFHSYVSLPEGMFCSFYSTYIEYNMEVSSLPDEITGGKKAIDIYSYLAQGEDGTQAKLRFNNQGAKISNRSIFSLRI